MAEAQGIAKVVLTQHLGAWERPVLTYASGWARWPQVAGVLESSGSYSSMGKGSLQTHRSKTCKWWLHITCKRRRCEGPRALALECSVTSTRYSRSVPRESVFSTPQHPTLLPCCLMTTPSSPSTAALKPILAQEPSRGPEGPALLEPRYGWKQLCGRKDQVRRSRGRDS